MDDVDYVAGALDQPNEAVEFVPVKGGETFKLGTITIRIIEDGSHTDNRIGIAEFTLPPKTPGPPAHWHEMHDETFLTSAGTVRYHLPAKTPGEKESTVDAKLGDFVVVPTRAPHTFSNPFDEEARFVNTYTPAFYINYFRLLARLGEEGKPMDPEANKKAMANYATIIADLSKTQPKR